MSAKENSSYDRIVTILDPNIECTLHNAHNCKMVGEYKIALKLFESVIEKDPENVRALHYKANVLDLMGNHSEAIRFYDTVLKYDPYHAEAWYNKGMTLKKMGSHEEGQDHIKKGISLALGEF